MEYGKIYSAVSADSVKEGVYGYFGDVLANVKEDVIGHKVHKLGWLVDVLGEVETCRFKVRKDNTVVNDWALFSPICTEENLEAYKAWCDWTPVARWSGITRLVYVRGSDYEPDFLKDTYEVMGAEENKYVPFGTIDELVEASGVPVVKQGKGCRPFIWLREKETEKDCLATGYDERRQSVIVAGMCYPMGDLFNEFTFLDGSPCGKDAGE